MSDYRGRVYVAKSLSETQRAAKIERQRKWYVANREELRAKARIRSRVAAAATPATPKTQWSQLRIGERRRVLIEQAIARGWNKYRICNELVVAEADYLAVRAHMDAVTAVG